MVKKRRTKKKQYKPSKLEVQVQRELDKLEIKYIVHPFFKIKQRWIVPDIYIPERNVCIEVNGCYWHGCSCRGPRTIYSQQNVDLKRYKYLHSAGFKVRVIWEHDIKVDIIKAVQKALVQ